MDFSSIALSKDEVKTLRKSVNASVSDRYCDRLLRHQLIEHECTHVKGEMPKPTGAFRATDAGIDYLAYYDNQTRLIWLTNAKIPIIVSFITSNLMYIAQYWLIPLLLHYI